MTEKTQTTESASTTPKPAATTASRPSSGAASRPRSTKPRFKRYERRRKVCRLCVEKVDAVDYKNIQMLKSFTMDSGKILSRRITGTCAKHQRQIRQAIMRNRNLSSLPYTNK